MPKTIRPAKGKEGEQGFEPALVSFTGDTFTATIKVGDPAVSNPAFAGASEQIADLIEDHFEVALGYRATVSVKGA